MRVFRHVLLCLLVLGLATGVWAGKKGDLMKEVEAIGDKMVKAMLADDVDTWLAMYAEDAISLPNYGLRMDGKAALKQHHEQMTAAGMKIHSFTSDPTDVWECGSQVIEIGTFAISLTMPGMPAPVADKGKYMTVYVREADGSLKIKADTWNTDMNPMQQMMGAPGQPEHKH